MSEFMVDGLSGGPHLRLTLHGMPRVQVASTEVGSPRDDPLKIGCPQDGPQEVGSP
jgi:hypothetical protein